MSTTEPNPGSSRTWWIVALVFVSGWCLYLYFFGPRQPEQHPAPMLEGTSLSKPADYTWNLYDLEGQTVSLGKYRGKTVFLNLWATWCPPCVAELPSIARLARTPQLENVAFLCVSTDQDLETVRQYVKGKDWRMTILHATDLPVAFRVSNAIPTTFLIAPDGRIAASYVGGAEWDDPSVVEFIARLSAALPQPAPGAAPR
jgi:thiol-disulfide isomerase/thioredoxin